MSLSKALHLLLSTVSTLEADMSEKLLTGMCRVQLASYLERLPLMWMMHLHVYQKSDCYI